MMRYVVLALLMSAVCPMPWTNSSAENNLSQCQCYLVSGPDPGYFQHYKFWDFRNISSTESHDYTTAPALVTTNQTWGQKPITSKYFNSSSWNADWAIQNGPQNLDASVPTFNSAQNVYISRNTSGNSNNTFLAMRASRSPSFMSIAEIQSRTQDIVHSSIRARFRIIPNHLMDRSALSADTGKLQNDSTGSNLDPHVDDGAVFGFFTYHSDLQEADVEILTRDITSRVHYSTQPDYNYTTDMVVEGASSEIQLPHEAQYTEWLEHRMDWFKDVNRWYVKGEVVRENRMNVPTVPSMLIFNLWGDGGNWSGNMSVGAQVTVGIEWIEMVYNTSSHTDWTSWTNQTETSSGSCDGQCLVDESVV